jgi:hypothetical protein
MPPLNAARAYGSGGGVMSDKFKDELFKRVEDLRGLVD